MLLLACALDSGTCIGSHIPIFVSRLNEYLENTLQSDMVIFDAVIVPLSFDARSSCGYREYHYILPCRMLQRNSSSSSYSEGESAIETFKKACALFVGVHSYHNFVRVSKVTNLRRFVSQNWSKLPFAKDSLRRPVFEGEERVESWVSNKSDGGCNDESDQGSTQMVRRRIIKSATDDVDGPIESLNQVSRYFTDYEEWPLKVLRETQTEIFDCGVSMISTERDAEEGGEEYLMVRLIGDSFCYNQIRYMMGAAISVAREEVPLSMLRASLELPLAMRWPLAPANGLVLQNAGFSHLNISEGIVAMDAEQNVDCNLGRHNSFASPVNTILLLGEEACLRADAFGHKILGRVMHNWKSTKSKDFVEWEYYTSHLRVEPEDVIHIEGALKRSLGGVAGSFGFEKLTREMERTIERRNFVDTIRLRGDSDHESVNVLRNSILWPSQFAASLAIKFQLLPGRRLKHVQLALAERIIQSRDKLTSTMDTLELLEYAEAVGPAILEAEGTHSKYNKLSYCSADLAGDEE